MVLRDDSAPHQIRLVFTKKPDARSVAIAVSCTCRATLTGDSYGGKGHGNIKYEPMGLVSNLPETWQVYNDPSNHNTETFPFHPVRVRGIS